MAAVEEMDKELGTEPRSSMAVMEVDVTDLEWKLPPSGLTSPPLPSRAH